MKARERELGASIAQEQERLGSLESLFYTDETYVKGTTGDLRESA